MQWRRSDLDFPVLMLDDGPWSPTVASVGGGGEGTLTTVGLSYGGEAEELRLETLVRRGRRMGPLGPQWIADRIEDQAGKALTDLFLNRARPAGSSSAVTRQHVGDAVRCARDLGARLPGPPWQVRSVRVDDVDFAMWSVTTPEGFAAALDCGPVVLAAWGDDVDAWVWRLTAAPPDAVWPLIGSTLDPD